MAKSFSWKRFLWRFTKRLLALVVLAFIVLSWFVFPRYITRIDELNTFFRRGRGKRIPTTQPHQTFQSHDGLQLAFDWHAAPGDSASTTVILLHGIRADRMQHADLSQNVLLPSGYNVVLLDHRAHGHSEGEWCTFGVKEGQDVRTLIDTLEASDMASENYVVWGYSLGGSVAAQALAQDERISAAIIESTFTSYPEVVHQYMKRFAFNMGWYGDFLIWRAASMADFDVQEACTECVLSGLPSLCLWHMAPTTEVYRLSRGSEISKRFLTVKRTSMR